MLLLTATRSEPADHKPDDQERASPNRSDQCGEQPPAGQRLLVHHVTPRLTFQEEGSRWEAKWFKLYYPPSYYPRLNLVKCTWHRLKDFLIPPRRLYDSVSELREAVLSALRVLGAVELQC